VARCGIPRRHHDGCDDQQCRGCLPGWAADGLRLCAHHAARIGGDAIKAAVLHGELELVLRPSGGGGRTGKPGSASPPRDDVVAMRTEIRHVLVSWCLLISEERGISLPTRLEVEQLPDGFIGPPRRRRVHDETALSVGGYVAKHAEWLAAQPYAGEVSDELASLASRARGIAFPSGTRRVEAGPCPLCPGTLTALVRTTDALLPSEVACDGDEAHRWASERWRELDRLVAAKRRAA
jgi:hypothetical protein